MPSSEIREPSEVIVHGRSYPRFEDVRDRDREIVRYHWDMLGRVHDTQPESAEGPVFDIEYYAVSVWSTIDVGQESVLSRDRCLDLLCEVDLWTHHPTVDLYAPGDLETHVFNQQQAMILLQMYLSPLSSDTQATMREILQHDVDAFFETVDQRLDEYPFRAVSAWKENGTWNFEVEQSTRYSITYGDANFLTWDASRRIRWGAEPTVTHVEIDTSGDDWEHTYSLADDHRRSFKEVLFDLMFYAASKSKGCGCSGSTSLIIVIVLLLLAACT